MGLANSLFFAKQNEKGLNGPDEKQIKTLEKDLGLINPKPLTLLPVALNPQELLSAAA